MAALRLMINRWLIALLILLCASATGYARFFVQMQGTQGPIPPPTFTGLAMSGLTFTSGSTSAVGTASASVSSGPTAPTWSIKTSGTDTASGAICNNYGSDFAINSSTGVVTPSAGAPVQSYPGTCIQATQSGLVNSPYSQAFTLVGSSGGSGGCPAPPAAAVAANFTTCVLAMNFTIPGGQFATLSNWLDVCGATGAVQPVLYGIPSSGRGTNPACAQFHIINDSANGNVQVLDETWNPTFGDAGNETAAFQTLNTNGSGGLSVRGGYYIQATYRNTSASYSDSTQDPNGSYPFVTEFWQFATCGDGALDCVPENDVDERYSYPGSFGNVCGPVSAGSGSTFHQWTISGAPGQFSPISSYGGQHGINNGYDCTLYETIGYRMTMDNVSSTGLASCAYVNGTATESGCGQASSVNAAQFASNNYFIISTGPQGTGGATAGHPSSTMDTYWQKIYIWSCAAWATTGCYNNPVLTTP